MTGLLLALLIASGDGKPQWVVIGPWSVCLMGDTLWAEVPDTDKLGIPVLTGRVNAGWQESTRGWLRVDKQGRRWRLKRVFGEEEDVRPRLMLYRTVVAGCPSSIMVHHQSHAGCYDLIKTSH